ncbi:DPB2 DNA polymerase epsilon subunit B [Candida maltosa Xu316]
METASLPIKLQPSNLRPIAFRILSKKHGLNLNTDALKVLTDTIGHKFGTAWKGVKSQQYLEEIAKIWKVEDRGLFIDANGLKQIIKDMNSNEDEKRPENDNDGNEVEAEDEEVEEEIDWKDYFKVIAPFQQPRSVFDKNRKQFDIVFSKNTGDDLLSRLSKNLPANIESYSIRYALISDRLSRNENFQKNSNVSISALHSMRNGEATSHEITLIKNMLGRDGKKFLLFGMLRKNSNDDYVLEDETDYIELNLTQTIKAPGSFYCPGMFLLVEGIYSASGGNSNQDQDYIGGCFYVSNIGHPPSERREKSLEYYGNLDYLGIHRQVAPLMGEKITKISKKFKKKLINVERNLINHKIIFIGSDLFLDNFKVLDKLKKFFQKLENSIIESDGDIPIALIFTGSFTSTPVVPTNSSITNITNSETYKSNFDNFTNILSQYEHIVNNCKIILIPGKNDPWQSTYSLGSSSLDHFPQSSIPKVFINRLERLLPRGNLIVTWNPTRINYLSQEIVILKDELMTKLKRNDIVFDNDILMEREKLDKEASISNQERINLVIQNKSDMHHLSSKTAQARKLVKTILDQGNLQPFPKLTNAMYDYSLRVEPLPTILVLQDSSFGNFEVTYNGCKVINVGSMNYMEYFPSSKECKFYSL